MLTPAEQQYELSISTLEARLVGLRDGRPFFRVLYRGEELGTIVLESSTRQPLPSRKLQILDMTGSRGGDTKNFETAVKQIEVSVRHTADVRPVWTPSPKLPGFLRRRGLTGLTFRAATAQAPFPRHEFEIWPAVLPPPRERRRPLDDPGPYGGGGPAADSGQPGGRQDAAPAAPGGRRRNRLAEAVRQGVDIVTDFVPGVSNVKDLTIFLTGINPVTGEKVPWWGRLLALVFAIPGVGNLLKYLGRGLKYSLKLVFGPLLKAVRRLSPRVRRLGERLFGRGSRIASFGGWAKARAAAALAVLTKAIRRNAADRLIERGTQVSGHFPYSAGPNAVLFRRSPQTGKVTHYAVYGPDGLRVKRVDLDPLGAAHGGVAPPHVMEYVRNTDPATGRVFANEPKGRSVRKTRPDEEPRVN
ncbi:polymorphic toxin type 24 domain-containing protein [Actinoplanes sp. CA-051413]|uniref:polymorphic toxin type 24 domain-containing protein n=1 Tax=Actinoplanes sp. CA-051413 TaxID=3239899 RepID=UPI003D9908EF